MDCFPYIWIALVFVVFANTLTIEASYIKTIYLKIKDSNNRTHGFILNRRHFLCMSEIWLKTHSPWDRNTVAINMENFTQGLLAPNSDNLGMAKIHNRKHEWKNQERNSAKNGRLFLFCVILCWLSFAQCTVQKPASNSSLLRSWRVGILALRKLDKQICGRRGERILVNLQNETF